MRRQPLTMQSLHTGIPAPHQEKGSLFLINLFLWIPRVHLLWKIWGYIYIHNGQLRRTWYMYKVQGVISLNLMIDNFDVFQNLKSLVLINTKILDLTNIIHLFHILLYIEWDILTMLLVWHSSTFVSGMGHQEYRWCKTNDRWSAYMWRLFRY